MKGATQTRVCHCLAVAFKNQGLKNRSPTTVAKYHRFTHHCPKNVHLIGGGCNTVFPPCLQGSPVFTACTVQCFQMFRWCMPMLNLKWNCDCGMAVLLSHTTICSANDWLNVSVCLCVFERDSALLQWIIDVGRENISLSVFIICECVCGCVRLQIKH